MHRQLLEGQVIGKRSRGKPRAKWMDNIVEWCKITSCSELVRGAQNRQIKTMTANRQNEDGTR